MAVKWHDTEVMAQVLARAEAKMDASAEIIVRNVKDSMRDPKSGVEPGAKHRRGFTTQRSAPGEAPAVQMGYLLRSITAQNIGRLARRVGTNVKYGLYLELGTRKMGARPFLRPTLDRSRAKIRALWSKP